VQQSLTNITMSREADLDHARQYYELLYLTADVSFILLCFFLSCIYMHLSSFYSFH